MASKDIFQRKIFTPTWEQFVGHENEVRTLHTAKDAAERRKEPLRPILLWGPTGCGKTTLARLVSGDNVMEVNGANLQASAIARAIFSIRRKRGTLLIDEVHAVRKKEQELLYPVMDNGQFYWMGQSVTASISVIGTTTELAMLAPPLRNRFSISIYVGPYSKGEIIKIVEGACDAIGIPCERGGAEVVASLARGIPRNAIALLDMARDFSGKLDKESADKAAKALGYDEQGLTLAEKTYIIGLCGLGGQASLVSISSVLMLDPSSVRSVEEFLLQEGFIGISSGGRTLTVKGWTYVEGLADEEF